MPVEDTHHLTWHTYGTWLPGEERGWVDRRKPDVQSGSAALRRYAQSVMVQEPVSLTVDQRRLVARVIRRHCRIRGWTLHALNVLPTHVHVVVTAPEGGELAMSQFKAWCSRRLNECVRRQEWWSSGGDPRPIRDEAHFANAVRYVVEEQEEAPLDDNEPKEPGAQATG